MSLAEKIERLYHLQTTDYGQEFFDAFKELKQGLNSGEIRAAEPAPGELTGWKVNAWVKMGILLGFRVGMLEDMSASGDRGAFTSYDKNTDSLKDMDSESCVRDAPGGSSIRDGSYLGKGVVCMPPIFVNVGAYVDDGVMMDSRALVGSCAQVGKRVHVGAASTIGGVLEPVGALPVIVEDGVLIGGNCGLYEGVMVMQGAVLAAGTILTGSTPVYDVVRGEVYCRAGDSPLVIPRDAIVVPGSRAVTSGPGKEWNISINTPVIVKYRDSKTDSSIRLEDLLR
jgi:2,3,4,5-tetrahydropyridine-2-carboxylate N-succinyltransferase